MDENLKSEAETRIALGSDLRIGRAREVFDALSSATKGSGLVVIDGSQVGKIDTAGLQALIAAIVRLRANGKVWHWEGGSAQLTSAAKLLGLDRALELQ